MKKLNKVLLYILSIPFYCILFIGCFDRGNPLYCRHQTVSEFIESGKKQYKGIFWIGLIIIWIQVILIIGAVTVLIEIHFSG